MRKSDLHQGPALVASYDTQPTWRELYTTPDFCSESIGGKYLEKDRKRFAAFMDLEKAYDRVDGKCLWDTLRVYGVGGILFEGIKFFYENASASVSERRAEWEFWC